MAMSALNGKQRSFGRGLGLTIVTLGIYAIYWHYKALDELKKQFGKGEVPMGLFIASLIPIVNLVAMPLYMANMLETVNDIRREHNLPPIFGLGGFLAWYILGSLIIVGPFVAYYKLQTAINECWAKATPKAVAAQPQWTAPTA